MGRSVIISTPVPSLEEVGKSLGLSKKRQASLLKLVRQDATGAAASKRGHRDTSVRTKKEVVTSK